MELVWDGDRRRERGNRCDAAQATEIALHRMLVKHAHGGDTGVFWCHREGRAEGSRKGAEQAARGMVQNTNHQTSHRNLAPSIAIFAALPTQLARTRWESAQE